MISDNEKQIRFQVLQMAQTMCDQEYILAQDIRLDAKRKYPDEMDVIAKAKVLMTFVDDISDPTVKSVTQLLTEHSGK